MSSCVNKEEDIMITCPTHISCLLRNVTIKCPDNPFVDHKRDCPSLAHCPDNLVQAKYYAKNFLINYFFLFFYRNFSFKL